MNWDVRLWDKRRERDWVAGMWLAAEAALPVYRLVPQRVAWWQLFRAIDAVLGHKHTAVLIATVPGQVTKRVGFLVMQQTADGVPTIYWVGVRQQDRREGVATALLRTAVPCPVSRDRGATVVIHTAVTDLGVQTFQAALPGAIRIHNPFPLWGLCDASKTGAASEVRFRTRMTRAFVHNGLLQRLRNEG